MNQERSALRQKLMGELIGLARATDGNTHLINPAATAVVKKALLAACDDSDMDPAGLEKLRTQVLEQKQLMVPDCFLCACPCGRTNAFDLALLAAEPIQVQALKRQLLSSIHELAQKDRSDTGAGETLLYKGLVAVGMEGIREQQLQSILAEMDRCLSGGETR